MRGEDQSSGRHFSYVDLEDRVPAKHPLRLIRGIVNDVLASMSGEFERLYSPTGRPSIAPEKLLRALLLQAFYTIRSERQLMEQLEFNLLFRWFVGLGMDDPVWDATVFCKNRDRLLEAAVSAQLLSGVVEHEKVRRLLSRDHFSVDGTLIEAWASMKSFRPKGSDDDEVGPGRNPEREFHGEKRSNETHESATDAEARLYRKGNGKESRLCYMGHALMENRNGLVVCGRVTQATGTAERDAALEMIDRHRPGGRRITPCRRQGLRRGRLRRRLESARRQPAYRHRRPPHQNRQAAQDQDRWAHYASCWLRRQPALPQAHRGGVRLGQGPGRSSQDPLPGYPSGRAFNYPHLEGGPS